LTEDDFKWSRITSLMRKGYSAYFIRKKLQIEDQIDVSKDEVIKIFEEHNLTEELLVKDIIDKKRPIAFKNESDRQKIKNKILRYLQNKGHNWEIVSFLVDEEFKVP